MSQAGPTYPTTWKRPPQIFTDPLWRRIIFSAIALYLFLAILKTNAVPMLAPLDRHLDWAHREPDHDADGHGGGHHHQCAHWHWSGHQHGA